MQTRTFQVELDIAEKAEKAGGELYHEHKQLITDLTWEYLEDRSIIMKSDLIDLGWMVRLMFIYLSHSIICFFPKSFLFVFEQIRVTTIGSKSSTDSGDLTTFSDLPASPVFNFFFVAGITFDILGVVFALASVLALRKMANTIREVKSNVCEVVWCAQNATPGHFCCRQDRCTIPARFPEDLSRFLHIMDHHSNVNFGAVVAFNAGMAFYFMSACTLGVITNQSVGDWVCVVLVMVVMVLFYVKLCPCTRTHWGIFLSYLAA